MKSDRGIGEGMDGQPERVEENGRRRGGQCGGMGTGEGGRHSHIQRRNDGCQRCSLQRDKLIYTSCSAGDGSRRGDMRGGMRSGVTSLPALTLVLHTALPCVKIVYLFRNA